MKKIFIGLMLVMVMFLATPTTARAATIAELQAMIAQLTAQLNVLLTQQNGPIEATPVVIINPTGTSTGIVRFVERPTLKLVYDNNKSESRLDGFGTISVQAGVNDILIGYINLKLTTQDGKYAPMKTSLIDVISGATQENVTTTDGYTYKAYRVKAGNTAKFKLSLTANPQIMFAGSYTVSLAEPAVVNSEGYYVSGSLAYQELKSLPVTIVGERSPYISGFELKSNNVILSGARFAKGDKVYINNVKKGVLTDVDKNSTYTAIPVSWLPAGDMVKTCYGGVVQIENSKTGKSNNFYVTKYCDGEESNFSEIIARPISSDVQAIRSTSGGADIGLFTHNVNLTAKNGDVYIPDSVNWVGSNIDRNFDYGLNLAVEKDKTVIGLDQYIRVASYEFQNAERVGSYWLIKEGQTANVNITVRLSSIKQTGMYRVSMVGFSYNDNPSNKVNYRTHSIEVGKFTTQQIALNGSFTKEVQAAANQLTKAVLDLSYDSSRGEVALNANQQFTVMAGGDDVYVTGATIKIDRIGGGAVTPKSGWVPNGAGYSFSGLTNTVQKNFTDAYGNNMTGWLVKAGQKATFITKLGMNPQLMYSGIYTAEVVYAQIYSNGNYGSAVWKGDSMPSNPVTIVGEKTVTPPLPPSVCPVLTRDLTVGSEGTDVTALQNFLASKGYLITLPSGSTGYFGNETKIALVKYQTAKGISPADGYLGVMTRKAIQADCGNTTVVKPSITITSPNGGGYYEKNTPLKVTWTTNIPQTEYLEVIRLRAYPNGQEYYLAGGVLNIGGTNVTIPSNVPAGAYTLEIKTYTKGSGVLVMDASDSYFKITDSAVSTSVDLKVNGSNNPSEIEYGSQFQLSWVAQGLVGGTCSFSGHYVPVVGGGLITDYRNEKTSGSFNLEARHSNYGFITPLEITIQCSDDLGKSTQASIKVPVRPAPVITKPSITVLSPNGGENWKVGETQRVTWNSNDVKNVRIYIYVPDRPDLGSGSTNYITPGNDLIPASQGYYDWTIASNRLPLGTALPQNYIIRVDSMDNGDDITVRDFSNGPFTINSATSVIAPARAPRPRAIIPTTSQADQLNSIASVLQAIKEMLKSL